MGAGSIGTTTKMTRFTAERPVSAQRATDACHFIGGTPFSALNCLSLPVQARGLFIGSRITRHRGRVDVVAHATITAHGKPSFPRPTNPIFILSPSLERIRFNPARIQLRRSSWHIRWA